MTSTRSNLLYTIAFNVFGILTPLVTYPYITRVLGPGNLGSVGVANGLAAYFIAFAGLGLIPYGVRVAAVERRDPALLSRTVSELFLVQLVVSALSFAAYLGVVLFSPAYAPMASLFAVVGAQIALAPLGFDWLFQGLEDFRFIGLRNMILQAATLVALFVFVRKPEDFVVYAGLASATTLASGLVSSARAVARTRPVLRGLAPGRHLKGLLSFTGINFLIAAYTNADFLSLGLFSTTQEAGYYTIPIKLARLTAVLGASLSTVLLPKLAAYASSGDEEGARATLRRSSSFLLLFALPAGAGLAATADRLVAIFGGPGYESAVPTLRAAALLVPLFTFTNFLQMQVLVPRGKEGRLAMAFGAGLGAAALANALLTPRFGHDGTMAATIIAEATVLAVQVAGTGRREAAAMIDGKSAIRYLCGAGLAAAAAWAACRLPLGAVPAFCAAVAAAVVLYVSFLVILRDPEAFSLLAWGRGFLPGQKPRGRG
jgi:O-antigen/teichoic acid export membrane protein